MQNPLPWWRPERPSGRVPTVRGPAHASGGATPKTRPVHGTRLPSTRHGIPARGGLPPRRHRVHLALSSRCQATAQEDGCDDGEAEGDGHRVEGFAEQRDGEDHSEDGLHQLHLADPDRATKGETPVPEEETHMDPTETYRNPSQAAVEASVVGHDQIAIGRVTGSETTHPQQITCSAVMVRASRAP